MSAMTAPEGLGPAGRAAWRAALVALEAMTEDPELARTALASYAFAVDAEARLRTVWTAGGRPTLAEGSSGQPVEHPLMGAMRDQAAHVAKLGDALLLTPKARASAKRAGWERGKARSADRSSPPPGLRAVPTSGKQ
jgi:phage terminase small subunit